MLDLYVNYYMLQTVTCMYAWMVRRNSNKNTLFVINELLSLKKI